MPEILRSELFWTVFSALVAFATLLGGIAAAVRAYNMTIRVRRLQDTLDKERKFYEEQARRVTATPEQTRLPQESAIDTYLRSINDGLLAIAQLPEEQRKETKKEIRDLLSQLRATHATLVEALKPFTTNDAASFFKEIDGFNQNFGALYNAGTIPHDARTHCGDVIQIVDDVASKLESDTTVAQMQQISTLRNLRYSMEYADQDLIVPIMLYILAKTEVELSLINSVIREGDKKKAIWLKERYRFDMEGLYKRLKEALDRMDDLYSKL